ncbi:MAG: SRPBCC family protein [Polyangiaceae bacterium]
MASTHRLERTQRIARPLKEVFAFFADAANLEAITPHFLRFRILTPQPIEMRAGTLIDYEISLLGLPMKWQTRIAAWEPNVRFADEQLSGPYAYWHHTHSFEAQGNATLMRDVVVYREPFGPLGVAMHSLFVERTLKRVFDYRAAAIERLFANAEVPVRAGSVVRI